MQGFRVSKYDPSRRDTAGRYREEKWISVHDIGRPLGGKTLSIDEYLRAENATIATAMAFHADAGTAILLALGVEHGGPKPDVSGEVMSIPPGEGQSIERAALPVVIRSCLREMMWCRLEARERRCMIHFGYDFYMYLTGIELPARACEVAKAGGLFLEPFESPYLLPV